MEYSSLLSYLFAELPFDALDKNPTSESDPAAEEFEFSGHALFNGLNAGN
jgi:hypothetical protein